MDVKVTAQRLCLLLSWQETLSRTPHQEAFAGGKYRRLAAQAEATLRSEARAAIEKTGADLQNAIATGASPEDVERLQHRIKQLNHLLKAQQSSDLGGPIALTLEAYAQAFKDAPPGPFQFTKLERSDFITIGVSLVLIAVISLGLFWFLLWRDNVNFTVEKSGPHHLALYMANEGENRVEFIGSWLDIETPSDAKTFGVSLSCKTEGDDDFQVATSVPDVWIFQNEVLAPQRRISVEPGATITVLLDLRELKQVIGSELAAVRLECGTRNNRRQVVFTLDL